MYNQLRNNYLKQGQQFQQQLLQQQQQFKQPVQPVQNTQQEINPNQYNDNFKNMSEEQERQFELLCLQAGLNKIETNIMIFSQTGKKSAEEISKEIGIDYSTEIGKMSFDSIFQTANNKIVMKYGNGAV